MIDLLVNIKDCIWGIPTIILILGIGLYLSFGTGFCQITLFPAACKKFFVKSKRDSHSQSGITPSQGLCTALAATVGTGNIAGVAGAIALGGPGTIFWMWVSAFIGMAVKYAEATLSVHYCKQGTDGQRYCGPMYMISGGMSKKWHFLAYLYAFLGVVAAFGVGNGTQINAVTTGLHMAGNACGKVMTRTQDLGVGILLALTVAVLFWGGTKRIAKAAEQLVPLAAICYLLLCSGILLSRFSQIPNAFLQIIEGAFAPEAVTGGALSGILLTMRTGISRGVFTNEAGMGTAAIAHGQAVVSHPSDQGLMGIVEVFIDTIIICTMTALAILCSGVSIPYNCDAGAGLTVKAFSAIYGNWVTIPLAVCICCFAFATVLGWGMYGARCAQFLFGPNSWNCFVVLETVAVILSAVLKTETVWLLSEVLNGMMAIPNMICLAALHKPIFYLTKEYRLLQNNNRGRNN